MTILLMFKLTAAIVSVALAAGLLARDHELTTNRLIAAFLLCNAFWATSEFYLYQTEDPRVATLIIRWMTFGWMPMGLLCMHASLSLSSMPDHPISRSMPAFYVANLITAVVAVSTDWVVVEALPHHVRTWRPIFGPWFWLAYLLMAAPVVTTLAAWRGLMNVPDREGEDRLARIVFFGISASIVAGTATAVVIPVLGLHAVGLTTTLVSFVGVLVAWTLRSFGHALISPEAFAREIFDTLDDGVVVLGQDGYIRDANQAFERMVGVERSATTGRSIRNWLPDFSTREIDLEASTFMNVHQTSGGRLPVVVSPPIEISAQRSFGGHVFLIRDRREVVSLQRQLAVSGRLAAVGDLSKSISESIHGPAATTQSHLERLGADWQAMSDRIEESASLIDSREAIAEGLEMISECIEGTDRITAIVREVGSFSADFRRGGFAPHALADIVESAVRIASAQASSNIELETRLDPDIRVLCHRMELERVVTNLLVNAIHALDAVDRPITHLTVATGAQGDRALLHIEDDGCGIPRDVLDRIFDPFFTTKPVGDGTGLGLAISYHIVRKHDGQIRVSSIEGRGTSVAVELPRVRPNESSAPE